MKNFLRSSRKYIFVATGFFLIGAFFGGIFSPSSFFESVGSSSEGCFSRTVVHVVDGDTVDLKNGARVRMIGIDAPELNPSEGKKTFYAREAKEALEEMISGKEVCLEKGRGDEKDKYDRLLRYIRDEGNFINAEMVKEGYARAYTRYPFEYKALFVSLEREAKEAGRGLWNEEAKAKSRKQTKNARGLEEGCGEATLCPERAVEYVGESKTVRFFVEASYDSGKAVFLNSMNDYENSKNFTAVIFASDFYKFPKNPASYYGNETVEVSGVIKLYNKRAEIMVGDPSQIRIIQSAG